MPVTASVQGQEHLEIACCKPIRLHAHGSHGLETISLHVFFCVHFMICDHVWVWVKLRVLERRKAFVIFRMIWNQSCEKGKVTVMTF